MPKAIKWILSALLAAYLVLPLSPCAADIYRWQDEQGHWHFSDSPVSKARIEQAPTAERWQSGSEGTAPESPDSAGPSSTPAAGTAGIKNDVQTSKTTLQGGLLWRIARNGAAPSHLLGTIHSADPRVVRLRPAVLQALDQSDRFIMEMVPDAAAMAELSSSMLISDGRDLKDLLGATLYHQVQNAMGEYGLPDAAVRAMKPWAAMALLSMPKPSPDPILDLVLQQKAAAAGKTIAGLETAQEQLAIFDGLSLPDQIDLLKLTLSQLPELPRFFDRLLQAYAADDLGAIANLSDTCQRQNDSDVARRFSQRLNDERNQRMVARLLPCLRQGKSFIAVGALHLAGSNGLLQLLRENGYDVMPIQ